jgi:putative ABC transport system permease protein
MAIITWPRLIAQNTKMQVASPAIEINRLFNLFGIGIQTLQFFGYGIFALSGVSIFIALYNQLKERNYEFALLRIYGYTPLQLSSLVLLEGLFLSLIGFLLGTIVGYIGLQLITNIAQEDYKMSFNPYDIQWQEQLMVLLVTLLVAILAALIPALKAYRLNISQTITQR